MAETTIGTARGFSPATSHDLLAADSKLADGIAAMDLHLAGARQAKASFGSIDSSGKSNLAIDRFGSERALPAPRDAAALSDAFVAGQQAALHESLPPPQMIIGHAVKVDGHVS